jgi:ribonuclease P protein component
MTAFSFSKSERLYKKKVIQELFDKGSSFYLYPFRIYFFRQPDGATINEVLFSVSKRNFKRAVDRNLLKRCMREAYRLQKSQLQGTTKFQIAYIYTAKEILPFANIQEQIIHSFKRLTK